MRLLEEQQHKFLLERESYSGLSEDDDSEDKPYKVINGIALYSIEGKMLSSGNFFTEFFGIATYTGISDALSMMAQDDSVTQILASVDTPGGSVSGISDVSEAWARVNAIKPITVHTPGMLASGGVWLTASSSKIYASETADVGSIGVILQHVSQQGLLDKNGIKVTEIKSSPMKHIGSPAKDLSESDKNYLQKKVDESNSLFQKQMYKNRPNISVDAFTGATFSASESLNLGLIDGIMSYSRVFEQLSASADSNNENSYTEDLSMKKRYVTAAMAEAAITAGADPDNLDVITQEAYDKLTPEEVEASELEAEQEQEPTEAELQLTAQIDNLSVDLSAANGQIETLTAQVAELTSKLEASKSDPLRVIAEERMGVMRVALGLSKVDFSEFSTSSLVVEYNAVDSQFKKNFKAGGHVKPKESTTEKKKATITSIDQARFSATGL
jgi:signal peptide peptidase SppA